MFYFAHVCFNKVNMYGFHYYSFKIYILLSYLLVSGDNDLTCNGRLFFRIRFSLGHKLLGTSDLTWTTKNSSLTWTQEIVT